MSNNLIDRLSAFFSTKPSDPDTQRKELIETLREAQLDGLMDVDALSMIEGVFQVGELSARDILLPRAQIDWIDVNSPLPQIIADVVKTGHSRFPVFEGSRDQVIGILLAKDLLRHFTEKDFQIRDWLRPAVFIPESKRLSVLLKDFRNNRNHLAIVVDEYGEVLGIVGESGSGKSTLLSCLAGHLVPDRGKVVFATGLLLVGLRPEDATSADMAWRLALCGAAAQWRLHRGQQPPPPQRLG